MKQAVLYLTNKSNEWTLSAFHALEQSLQGEADVYFAYHQQGNELPVVLQAIRNLFVFTSDILDDLGYTPIEKGKLVPGSNHFPLLKFFKENQEYDYYWLVEDDVRFSGEWKDFFNCFASNTSDFLSSVFETKEENPNWYWWTYLKAGENAISEDKLLRSFNPIYRLSHQALVCIDGHLREGWMGHHEVLFPTLLFSKGFRIEDFGGDGSFVKSENKVKFYDQTSMRIAPILPDDRKNYLFHPVKEEKVRQDGSYKKNAVFVTAGKDSLHRQLLKGDADFDLHLLIYDGSYNKFCNDADFIACDAGYKMDMTYRYLQRHPELLEKYEYFFLLDDNIVISTEDVNRLFAMMRKYQLKIAQPSLVMSYYTYKHTAFHPFYILRYTNFVEMMMPCFSRNALKNVLPTFEARVRWSGVEIHWPVLVETNHKDIAIFDAVSAKHTRIVQSWNATSQMQLDEYLKKHNLTWSIEEYGGVIMEGVNSSSKQAFDELRVHSEKVRKKLYNGGLLKMKKSEVTFAVYALMLDSILWNDHASWDVAARLADKLNVLEKVLP